VTDADLRLPEADARAILAYLDGRLTAEEERAFELRLAREPALARVFGELADTDRVLRAALAPELLSGAGRRPGAAWRWIVIAAAAALVLAMLLARRGDDVQEPATFRFALVGTAPSDVGFNEELGLDPDWLPVGMGYRAEDENAPGADEYARRVQEVFDSRVERALTGEWPDSEDAWRSFVVAVQPDAPSHALLLVVREGEARLLVPDGESRPLEPGRPHLLPAEPVRLPDDWRDSMRVDYRPGILTRGEVEVILAVRRAAPEEGLLDELRRRCDGPEGERTGSALSAWLAERGFEVRRRVVSDR